MEIISKADALNLASKWERQNQTISVLCFGSSIALSSKNVRVAMCLDECIQLSLADEVHSAFSLPSRSSQGWDQKTSRGNLSICFLNSNKASTSISQTNKCNGISLLRLGVVPRPTFPVNQACGLLLSGPSSADLLEQVLASGQS
jgi:hypothetical protein